MSDVRMHAELFALQRGRCVYCRGSLASLGFQSDHIVPRAMGGSDDRRNRQLTCGRCNRRKGARDPMEFARSLGLLL